MSEVEMNVILKNDKAAIAEKKAIEAKKKSEKLAEKAAIAEKKAANAAEKTAKLAKLLEKPYEGEKTNIFTDEKYIKCEADAAEWEKEHGPYIRGLLCCKEVITNDIKKNTLSNDYKMFAQFSSNTLEEIVAKMEIHVCVLPLGHAGKCCKNPHMKMFKKGALTNKFDTGIYSTPGNDAAIYKNRAPRLHPIAITDDFERKIKEKEKKMACCIPLKDRSTPLMLASAWLDCLVICASVSDINLIKDAGHEYWVWYKDLIVSHKKQISSYFEARNRAQFDKTSGFTICPVNGYLFTVSDFTRDSRVAPKETDAQLGHCLARKESRYTIRGFNISFMSREGNRLVGDHDFFDDDWIDGLKRIVSRF